MATVFGFHVLIISNIIQYSQVNNICLFDFFMYSHVCQEFLCTSIIILLDLCNNMSNKSVVSTNSTYCFHVPIQDKTFDPYLTFLQMPSELNSILVLCRKNTQLNSSSIRIYSKSYAFCCHPSFVRFKRYFIERYD